MDAPRPQPDAHTLKRRFVEAIELPPEQRRLYLDDLVTRDAPLHAALERLLLAHDQAGLFLSEPTHGQQPRPAAPPEEEAGDRVGPFVLLERLGEGGFAVVWRARQEQPVSREVALKILKPGMDSRQVLARFDAERHTLALLTHPSIARVLDAGVTPRGRPYFAMELVAGKPITEFCDAERLAVPERLELFIAVCMAVQHAHQKGIVHRDLKPSNILVTKVDGRPVPVVIDFGIAKAIEGPLTDATAVTEARQIIGTPQYMAPEQADFEHASVDTRTDVYSLGVILYELLTGVSPYDLTRLKSAGIAERASIVRETRPNKPSTRFVTLGAERETIAACRKTDQARLVRELRGDLDWIVLRATEKDPEHRYPTANALAADVRHHLRDEPVLAGPPSRAYLLAKFVRRHRAVVYAVVAVVVAIVSGLALSLASLQHVNALRNVAETALQTANGRLWDSYIAQARASRASSQPGRRDAALTAAWHAAVIRPTLEIRNEAIAAMALDDVSFTGAPPRNGYLGSWGLRTPGRAIRADPPDLVRVVSVPGDTELMRARSPGAELLQGVFNADGSLIACTMRSPSGSHVEVRDVRTGALLASLTGPEPYGAELRLGGAPGHPPWVAVSAPRAVEVRSAEDGATILHIPAGAEEVRFDVSADGRTLLVSDAEAGHLQRWSIERAECVATLPTDSPPISVAAPPDGHHIAVGFRDRSIQLIDGLTGRVVQTFLGHQGLPVRLGFHSDGRLLTSYAWDNTIRFWDINSGSAMLAPIEGWLPVSLGQDFLAIGGERVARLKFSPSAVYDRFIMTAPFGVNSEGALSDDGRRLVTAGSNGVMLLDAGAGRVLRVLTDASANGVCILPDCGLIVAACDAAILAWPFPADDADPGPGREILRMDPPGDVWVAPGPDPGTIAVVHRRAILVLSIDSGETLLELPAYQGLAERPVLSPDGRWLFTGNWRGPEACVWDLQTRERVLTIGASHAVARFSPAGDAIVVGTPESFTCFDVPSWRQRWIVAREWTDSLAGVIAFAPDGDFLAVGHSRYQLRLLDPGSGAELATLRSPDMHELNDAIIAPDASTLMCTTVDRVVQRWRLSALRAALAEIHPLLDPLSHAE